MEIRENTVASGWVRAVKTILNDGDEVVIPEYGATIEYDEPLIIHIEHPSITDDIDAACRFSKQFMTDYATQLTSVTKSDFAYTYGNRLFDYPTKPWCDSVEYATCESITYHEFCGFCGNGHGCGVNQIKFIIDTLRIDPSSRRAIAITRFPELDCESNEPPCLTTVQCKIRDNRLHMTCYFRSNDMYMAWYCNAVGLTSLMYQIFDVLRHTYKTLEIGALTTISECPHIYIERDKSDIDAFRSLHYGC